MSEPARKRETCSVLLNRCLKEDKIIEHLKGIDGLISGFGLFDGKAIAAEPQLKAIARVSISVAEKFGVNVSSAPDGPVTAVHKLLNGLSFLS